ncbi:MAG: hypothetical protein ACLQM8_20355 [Limisphaerales bacterium]
MSLKAASSNPGATEQFHPGKRWPANLLLLAGSLALFAGLSEIGLRLFFANDLRLIQDDRSLLYRYDKILGWFPIPGGSNRFAASRPIRVINNSEGFRAPEHTTNSQPGILFLGDSFVWGYDVEAAERFTEKLQAKHPEWNVYNLGVSGYGTDQEFLLLQLHYAAYKPRVVFLVYSTETDEEDNSTNARYGGYYKPYCTIVENRLQIQGIPVPRSERVFLAEHTRLARSCLVRLLARAWFKLTAPPVLHNPSPTAALIRNLQKYVNSQGALFLVGLTAPNPPLQEYLRHCDIPFVGLGTPLRYPGFGNHWTPEGHTFVCAKIDEFLAQGHYVVPERRRPVPLR